MKLTNKLADTIWEKGWLDEILDEAEKEVKAWPEWMQQPEMRYPINRHAIHQEQLPDKDKGAS